MQSCGKEEASVFSFEKERVSIVVGEETSNAMKNGSGPYTVKSFKGEIVSATVDNNAVRIRGLQKGTCTVMLSDKEGARAQFAVEVKNNPKTDESLRLEWDGKTEYRESFSLTKDDEKRTFHWESADKKNSASLEFDDKSNLVRRGSSVSADTRVAKSGTFRTSTNGEKSKKMKVSDVTLIKSVTQSDGSKTILWLKFTADKKEGLCVGAM